MRNLLRVALIAFPWIAMISAIINLSASKKKAQAAKGAQGGQAPAQVAPAAAQSIQGGAQPLGMAAPSGSMSDIASLLTGPNRISPSASERKTSSNQNVGVGAGGDALQSLLRLLQSGGGQSKGGTQNPSQFGNLLR